GWDSSEFTQLHRAHDVALDAAERADLGQEALAFDDEEAPSVTLWYPSQREATRSDRFTNFTKQPTDGGVIANQVGYRGYAWAEPVGADEASSGGGLGVGGWVGIGAAAIVVLGGGGWLLSRRKSSDDRE